MTRDGCKIFRCGIPGIEAVQFDTSHVFPRHTHEQFGIGAIDRGGNKSLSGRGMVEAGPGDIITVNPGEVHDGAPMGDAGRAWRILYFDPSLIAETLHDMRDGKTVAYEFIHPVVSDARLSSRLRKLFSILTEGDKQETDLERQELLLMLLPRLVNERGERASIPKAVFLAKALIDDDPAASITLSGLAVASGLSRFQVVRAFVKATGLTPHAYLTQCRIDLARRLIRDGTRLAEAALASGFADQSHMTRVFVRRYGISPRAYAGAVT
jgi:AraC-like DNA-binding protein